MRPNRIFAIVFVALMLMTLVAFSPVAAWPGYSDGEYLQYGPYADELIFNVYGNPELEYDALEADEIDFTEWTMTRERKDKYLLENKYPDDPWSNYIGVADYYERGMYQFDLNLNETFTNTWGLPHLVPYEGKINPTTDLEFRKALNFLADKDAYVTEITKGMAGAMDTVLDPPPPWGPFVEYDGYYYDGTPFYYYDPTEAEAILDAAGWADIDGDGNLLPNERNVPAWVDPARPEISEYLGGGLVFVMRTDKPLWMGWSNMFADAMEAVGIPVLRDAKDRLPAIYQVLVFLSFHIYAGGWSFGVDPLYVRDLWYSDWYVGPGALNIDYTGYQNPLFDAEADKLFYGESLASAQAACRNAQKMLKEDTPTIPLVYTLGAKAYSRTVVSGTYAGETLGGLVNQKGYGINAAYSDMNAHAEDAGGNPLVGGTIVQGLSTDIESMNPISAMMYYDYDVTDNFYSGMISQDPYNPGGFDHDIPWVADSWEDELYDATGIMDPDMPGYPYATKLTFHLDQNQLPRYCDGTYLTAEDFAFTIFIQKKCGPDVSWRFGTFEPIDHTVVVDPYTIELYYNAQSIYFIHMIGFEYILPKHIWENCKDYGPDDVPGNADDRLPIHPDWDPMEAVYFLDVFTEPQYLIGNGPYKFTSRLAGMWIVADRNPYFFHSLDAWNTWHETGDIDLAKEPAGSQPANCYMVGLGDLWYILFYWDEDTTDHPTTPGGAPPEADVLQPRNYHIDLGDYGQIKLLYDDIW